MFDVLSISICQAKTCVIVPHICLLSCKGSKLYTFKIWQMRCLLLFLPTLESPKSILRRIQKIQAILKETAQSGNEIFVAKEQRRPEVMATFAQVSNKDFNKKPFQFWQAKGVPFITISSCEYHTTFIVAEIP